MNFEEQRFVNVCDKLDERISTINLSLYTQKIREMDEEDLHYEFSEKIGDELNDFESILYHYGRKMVEDMLIDYYEDRQ